MLPVKAEDVLAHLNRVLHFTFITSPEQVTDVSQQQSKAGSNGWAIAPSHSEKTQFNDSSELRKLVLI